MKFGIRALESGIQLKESWSHYRLECGIHIPLTKNPESGTWNPESTTWSPESKTVLDFFTWGNILTDNLSIRWSRGEKVIFTWTANQASAFDWWCYHLKMAFVIEWPKFPLFYRQSLSCRVSKWYQPMTIKDTGVCSSYLDPRLSLLYEVEDDVIRPCKIYGMLDTCPKIPSINQGRLTPAISF